MKDQLEHDLAQAGIAVRVEVRERLAILIAERHASPLTSLEKRRAALQLASERGFTHVALELLD